MDFKYLNKAYQIMLHRFHEIFEAITLHWASVRLPFDC